MANKKNTDPNVHVRIQNDIAIHNKKNLLMGQIDILRILKKLNKYMHYRKQELALREILKGESQELHKMITEYSKTLPRVQDSEKERIKQTIQTENRGETLQTDLEKIREKLTKLKEYDF